MEQDQERAHRSDSLALAQQALGTRLIKEQASLLSDVPSERDLLNYTDYRDALVSVIRRLDVDVPLTVGVFGAWGSGKTTLLSLVERELRRLNKEELGRLKGTHTETTWVNVWQVSNEEDIWAAFLQSLLLKVKEEMPWHRRLLFNIMGVVKWQVDWRLATKRVVLFLVRIVIVVVPLYFSLSNLVPSSQAGQSVPETIAAGAGTLFSSVLFLVQYWGGIWSSSHIFKR